MRAVADIFPRKRAPRRSSKAIGYCRDRSGATAIEFALIAPVFLAFVFSLFEIGFLFVRMTMVEHAVNSVARSVYTGEVTKGVSGGTITQADIEAAVCNNAAIISNCMDEVTVELTEVASLSSLPATNAICTDSWLDAIKPSVTFNPGSAQSTVFMRVCVTIDLLTPGLGFGLNLTKTATGRYQIVASTAFKNEPF